MVTRGDINARTGSRLKRARKALGLSQQEVASRSDILSRQALLQIEKGGREIKVSELSELSSIYHKDTWFFIQPDEPEEVTSAFAWRKADAKTDTSELQARVDRILGDYQLLEEISEQESKRMVEPWGKKKSEITRDLVRDRAERMVKERDLGYRPAANLSDLVQNVLNIKLLYLDLGELGSAVCAEGAYGFAIIINSSEVPWRRSFNLAHELFHVLTSDAYPISELHRSAPDEQQKVGKLADEFAATLLMPKKSILSAVKQKVHGGRIEVIDLIHLAVEFGVSTQALLWRLVTLGGLKPEQVRKITDSADFQTENKRVRTGTYLRPPEYSTSFVLLALRALQEGRMSKGKFCNIFEITRSAFEDFIATYGFVGDLVDDKQASLDHTGH